MMKKLLYILTVVVGLAACEDTIPGYLVTSNAGYTVDSLVVRAELEIESVNPTWDLYISFGYTPEQLEAWGIQQYIKGDDYYRATKMQPWVGTPIEGVRGTNPIQFSFEEIKLIENGDVNSFLNNATVRGNGTIEIPFDNDVVPGRYLVSLEISNEGYTQIVNDVFTVIVEEPVVEPAE